VVYNVTRVSYQNIPRSAADQLAVHLGHIVGAKAADEVKLGCDALAKLTSPMPKIAAPYNEFHSFSFYAITVR
jgi:hypothetical protein